jgi:predicted DNA-binding transcriptional regulator AlpA
MAFQKKKQISIGIHSTRSYSTQMVLSREEVIKMTGLSRSTIQRLENMGTFPKRRQLSERRVGWIFLKLKIGLTTGSWSPFVATHRPLKKSGCQEILVAAFFMPGFTDISAS